MVKSSTVKDIVVIGLLLGGAYIVYKKVFDRDTGEGGLIGDAMTGLFGKPPDWVINIFGDHDSGAENPYKDVHTAQDLINKNLWVSTPPKDSVYIDPLITGTTKGGGYWFRGNTGNPIYWAYSDPYQIKMLKELGYSQAGGGVPVTPNTTPVVSATPDGQTVTQTPSSVSNTTTGGLRVSSSGGSTRTVTTNKGYTTMTPVQIVTADKPTLSLSRTPTLTKTVGSLQVSSSTPKVTFTSIGNTILSLFKR